MWYGCESNQDREHFGGYTILVPSYALRRQLEEQTRSLDAN
jgi:hypothetical protein